VTFESVYYVLRAEKLLKQSGYEVILIPVPREFSSDCGMALKLFCNEVQEIKGFLEENGVTPVSCHEWKTGG
jgi:hypothetical protein